MNRNSDAQVFRNRRRSVSLSSFQQMKRSKPTLSNASISSPKVNNLVDNLNISRNSESDAPSPLRTRAALNSKRFSSIPRSLNSKSLAKHTRESTSPKSDIYPSYNRNENIRPASASSFRRVKCK